VFIYGVNEHKKGQIEPAGLGKLIEKQFSREQEQEQQQQQSKAKTKPLELNELAGKKPLGGIK
jgi:hypothetical protein